MYPRDDMGTAKFLDRLLAAAIAGFCGLFPGSLLAALVLRITGEGVWVVWFPVVALAVYGFFAPSRFRDAFGRFIGGR